MQLSYKWVSHHMSASNLDISPFSSNCYFYESHSDYWHKYCLQKWFEIHKSSKEPKKGCQKLLQVYNLQLATSTCVAKCHDYILMNNYFAEQLVNTALFSQVIFHQVVGAMYTKVIKYFLQSLIEIKNWI